MPARTSLRVAVVGAGPVGLALALLAARTLPHVQLALFDARPLERDTSADARTLALSLGSVQLLKRLGIEVTQRAQPITAVHVSQAPPSLAAATVVIRAAEQGVPLLGAVLPYGSLLAPLQAAWVAAADGGRLQTRFGTPVAACKPAPGGVEIDAAVVDTFDLAVVAEGGMFAEQARKSVVRDYGQTAWVGSVTLDGAEPGMAFERFTPQGPAALLPLPPADGRARAALVWCVDAGDDPVRDLDATQRLAVLNTLFPAAAGRITSVSPLKSFALGLNAERSLVDGRIVRIGNAAQTLHPVAGQGLNLGLRDAYELVAALRRHDDVDRALRRVEWTRAADRWSIVAATDFLARSFTWRGPGVALARAAALVTLQSVAPLKQRLARHLMFGGRH